jgi:hypothetical protein
MISNGRVDGGRAVTFNDSSVRAALAWEAPGLASLKSDVRV